MSRVQTLITNITYQQLAFSYKENCHLGSTKVFFELLLTPVMRLVIH